MVVDKQEDVLVYLEDAYSFLMDPAIGIAIKEIKRVRQQNAELVNALRPFVDLGRAMLPADEYDDSVWVTMPDDTPVRNLSLYNFTVGDFRKAAKATGE
jgi:hypothetical protein